ncbi:MAG: hypothetical protein M5R42_15320 [Rhodocyclaceae bacterium]|nr:hypothetical protein [Rhodocyclaceae bacterium]
MKPAAATGATSTSSSATSISRSASIAKEKASPGKKMIVDHLSIRDIKVNYSPILLEGKGFEISLPDIELRDIGKNKGGVTSGELAKTVTDALMTRMTRAITDTLRAPQTSRKA